jgi:hypothetical protein
MPLLRARAKDAGIEGYSRMRKGELVGLLADEAVLAQTFEPKTVPNRWIPAECGCEHPTRRCAECDLAMDAIHAKALEMNARADNVHTTRPLPAGYVQGREKAHSLALIEHLEREASQHRVLIVTGGELHDWSAAPKADFVLNLSRVLRDPAHVPSGEMLDMRGDLDLEVGVFVMATEGAEDLWSDWVVMTKNAAQRSPLIVHVMCRGGKHRAPAFGRNLQEELGMWGEDAVIHHLHAHLPRVIKGETT